MAHLYRSPQHFLFYLAVLLCCIAPGTSLARSLHVSDSLIKHRMSGRLSETVAKQLDWNGYAEVLISLDDSPVQELAARERRQRRLDRDDHAILRKKAALHRERKERLLSSLAQGDHEVLKEFEYFGVLYLKASDSALARLLDDPEVVGVHENRSHELFLAESLPLTGQPAAAARGYKGAGSVVAVLDTGVDFINKPVFGNCSSVGVPAATCKVVYTAQVVNDTGILHPHDHGTNVSGIIAGFAQDVRLAVLDVADWAGRVLDADVLSALDWVMNNHAAFNIAAVNLSFGHDSFNSYCAADLLATPLQNVRSVGVVPVIASGNSGLSGLIAAPACVPAAVSVGAVYDSTMAGTLSWPSVGCSDSAITADKVLCITNLASFLTLLAPGANITSAGITMQGTSQAAPHVAGAVAVLAAAEPGLTTDQIVERLKNTGKPISTTRGLATYTIPRLNLDAALQPNMTVAPASLDFGTIPVGSFSPVQAVSISSNGLGDISINSVVLGGDDPSAFEIVGDSCSSIAWPPYVSECTIGVRFLAQSAGTRSAKLTFSSNDPAAPEVMLTGLSADFNPLPPIRLMHSGQVTYYDLAQSGALQNALNAAVDGDTLQMRSVEISEMLVIDKAGQQISVEGGFDGSYNNQTAETTLLGSMILKAGKLAVRNFKIR